jgi:LysM repeat protein
MSLLAAAGLAAPARSAQATTTTTSITRITLATAPGTAHANATLASESATAGAVGRPTAPAARKPTVPAADKSKASAASKPATTWTVRQGDSLSVIATAFGVPGGWQTLYAANRQAIGPNPNVIRPGTILKLPRRQAPMRYTVMPGDTLSGIAAALAVPGGWQTLYAANRQAIGPNPNVIRPGTVLTARGETLPPATHNEASTPPAHAGRPRPSAQPTGPASEPQRVPAVNAPPPATGTMPNWLKDILIAAGLLAAIAFAIEPVAVLTRRRRTDKPTRTPATQAPASLTPTDRTPPNRTRAPRTPANTGEPDPAGQARIILADHERLIVTYSSRDDTIYVLTPPGEDPKAVLCAARLILPEDRYEDLADRLGVSSALPFE